MGNIIGERIRMLREEAGIKQGELAEILQTQYGFITPRTTISRWENGKQEPEAAKIKAIARIFGVTMDFVAGISDSRDDIDRVKMIDFIRGIPSNNLHIYKAILSMPIDRLETILKLFSDLTGGNR